MVRELRVRSFTLRHQLEQVTDALLVNLRCGFWIQARRAALDLGDLVAWARTRRLAEAKSARVLPEGAEKQGPS